MVKLQFHNHKSEGTSTTVLHCNVIELDIDNTCVTMVKKGSCSLEIVCDPASRHSGHEYWQRETPGVVDSGGMKTLLQPISAHVGIRVFTGDEEGKLVIVSPATVASGD
ncbi:putative spermatogenesis-associated protein 31E1-like [Sesbania bispinosa]|nr:putative spermatogenesis-associated protein 31E1-like [Sesbania bispinosa]